MRVQRRNYSLLGWVGAAGEFGLEVIAEGGGDDAGFAEVVEIGGVYFGQKGEDGGERCAGGANQCEADAVDAGPAAMLRDGVNDRSR